MVKRKIYVSYDDDCVDYDGDDCDDYYSGDCDDYDENM